MTEVEKIKEAQMLRDEDSFTRARREAYEVQEMRDRLAKVEAESASRTRNRLEKGSPSWARRNFADILNGLVADSASRELPELAALEGVCKRQQLGYRTAEDHNAAHARFEKAGGGESFNRLHPQSHPGALERRSDFEIDGRDPGNVRGSRFEESGRFAPSLNARRTGEAGGRLRTRDARDRDRWPSGEVEDISPRFLLAVAERLIEWARREAAKYPEGRFDQRT